MNIEKNTRTFLEELRYIMEEPKRIRLRNFKNDMKKEARKNRSKCSLFIDRKDVKIYEKLINKDEDLKNIKYHENVIKNGIYIVFDWSE